MIKKINIVTSLEEYDYESYFFTMTVGELIELSYSSPIQRIRNEKKEDEIKKFIKNLIEKRETPYLQPFILHYDGNIKKENESFLLDPEKNIVIMDNGNKCQYAFEVLDGNGRLNAMKKLMIEYKDNIYNSTKQLEKEIGNKRKLESKIYFLKNNLAVLRNINITIQLYLNLRDEQKAKLFNSVNQGEAMAKGRLKIYDDSKIENRVLNNYILHTKKEVLLPFKITPDKDIVRTQYEKENLLPAIYLLPAIRQCLRYCRIKGILEIDNIVINTLDIYLANSKNMRKRDFYLLANIIKESTETNTNLNDNILKLSKMNYDNLKNSKEIKDFAIKYIFGEVAINE